MDAVEIKKWHDVFKRDNELFEIRIIGDRTWSGYFYNIDDAIKCLQPFDKDNIYYSINEVKQACASREQFNCFRQVKGTATSKGDIEHRWWMPIDVDCVRPTGVSSTNAEKQMAHKRAQEIYVFLRNSGFSEPVICDSSSGYHLLYPIDMDNVQESEDCIKAFLETLSNKCSDESVKIDTVLCDANRILRLPGSFGRKGRSSEERPHRMAKILVIPKEIKRMSIEQIKAFNANYEIKVELPKRRLGTYNHSEEFNLRDFITKYGIEVTKEVPISGGGTKFILKECPWDSSHKAPDSALFELPSGAVAFKCYHNSCSHYDWKSFRLHFDPQAYDNDRQWTPKYQQEVHRTFQPDKRKENEHVTSQDADEKKGSIWQSLAEIDDEDRSKIVSIRSGITLYDRECCGFDKPSFNIWSGNNGSAKSTLLNQIALNAVNEDFKVAIYSGELRGKRLKRWLVLQAAGRRYNVKSTYNDYDYYTPLAVKDKVVSWLDGKLFNYNTKYSHDIDVVCAEIEKIVKEKKIDMLVADNLSSLDIDEFDGQVTEQQKNAIKTLLRLTEKLEIVTHLVVHPKKSEGFLRKNDISGVKTITDLADNVFICHRWNQDTQKSAADFLDKSKYNDILTAGATNIVEVIKHREFGQAEGHIYMLYYEPESKRLKNSKNEDITYGWQKEPVQLTIPQNDIEPNASLNTDDTYNDKDDSDDWLTPRDEEPPF